MIKKASSADPAATKRGKNIQSIASIDDNPQGEHRIITQFL